jgi:hypothetical protein
MAFIFDSGKHPHRYVYVGFSYRDAEGKPRNKRVRVGKVDNSTGIRVYNEAFIGQSVVEGIEISDDVIRKVEEEDRQSREEHPELFGDLAEENKRREVLCRRRMAPMFSFADLESAEILEGGTFPLLERKADDAGLLTALKARLPECWEGVFSLAVYLASRSENLEGAEFWGKWTDGLGSDLSFEGIRAALSGVDSASARIIPQESNNVGAPRPVADDTLVYVLGPDLYLPVGVYSRLPCGSIVQGFSEKGPPPIMVLPSFGSKPPQTFAALKDSVKGARYLVEAPEEIPEVAEQLNGGPRQAPPKKTRAREGQQPSAVDLGPWLHVGPNTDPVPRAAWTDTFRDSEMALDHLGLRTYLQELNASVSYRLASYEKILEFDRHPYRRDLVQFVTLYLASLVWGCARNWPSLRELHCSAIFRELSDVRRVYVKDYCYTQRLTDLQADIHMAFGFSGWELKGISGQARPLKLT